MAADQEIFARRSFSQFGEDGVLTWLFHDKYDGFYVDVGCHHPYRISNTALLYLDKRWRGINIDVDERAIAAFELARPEDINICLGVAESSGQRQITIFDEGAINSFDEASANHPAWAHIGRLKKTVEVRPLREILATHMPHDQVINFMNIDAEGLDYEVVQSNDWARFSPETIAIEAGVDIANANDNKTIRFLQEKGFRIISHVAITTILTRI